MPSGLGIRAMLASWNEVEMDPSFIWGGDHLRMGGGFYVWHNSPGKPPGPGLFLAGNFTGKKHLNLKFIILTHFQVHAGKSVHVGVQISGALASCN